MIKLTKKYHIRFINSSRNTNESFKIQGYVTSITTKRDVLFLFVNLNVDNN